MKLNKISLYWWALAVVASGSAIVSMLTNPSPSVVQTWGTIVTIVFSAISVILGKVINPPQPPEVGE